MSENTEMRAAGIKVFVYGTLKEGHGNHHWFLNHSQFLGRAVVEGRYRMRDLGGFPVVERVSDTDAPDQPIFGEVYLVRRVLTLLNALKSHSEFNIKTGVFKLRDSLS